ncbi:uncharacterized protein LOC123199293 isoform X4 [Mangifera indica]|uniref:uncharacterized protein LOC123199293 isoform X4 n=1 Tax=Mangifera indica TaxID=29780 RepID=UPI001CFB73EE|nr:uncharacterized protein LOC123199293 isoform X4 [Mangifera indica]
MTILQIAILGAGIFVKTQYYPRLSEISDIVSVKFIWSPSEEFAKSAVEIARKHFGGLEAVWGNQRLDRSINEGSCLGVAVVRARQFQVEMTNVYSFLAGRFYFGYVSAFHCWIEDGSQEIL